MDSNRLVTCTFRSAKQCTTEGLSEILLDYNEEDCRFNIKDYDERYLDGYYCVKVNKNETSYDFISGTFETTMVTRTLVAHFSFDVVQNRIIVCGGKVVMTRMFTAFSLCFNNDLTIDVVEPDLGKILAFTSKNDGFVPLKAKICDVPIAGGFLANCIVALSEYENKQEFLVKYSENISQISLLIVEKDDEFDDFTITIYGTGYVVLHKELEDLVDVQKEIILSLLSV